MKYWIEISEGGDIIDYILEDFPHIEDMDEYFAGKYDMLMGPREYWLDQKPVKSPPKEWLERKLKFAKIRLTLHQKWIETLESEIQNEKS